MSYAYPYIVITPPVNLAVSLDTAKEYLKLDPADTSQDDLLTMLIITATDIGEKLTSRTFINTGFRTYRSIFKDCFSLRRSKLQSLEKYQYSVEGSFIDVDSSIYYTTEDTDYSKLLLKPEETYPEDIDPLEQAILIEFTAGYGEDDTDIPAALRLAILQHLAQVNENRGDCEGAAGAKDIPSEENLPAQCKIIYDKYKILNLNNCENNGCM